MLRIVPLAFLLAVVAIPARADSCSSVVPGAQMGPSPSFNGWPWQNACYISWPGGYINDRNARFTYEPKCKEVPGFLHFEGDYGSNRNTCIFSAPVNAPARADVAPPATASAPSRQEPPPETPNASSMAQRPFVDPTSHRWPDPWLTGYGTTDREKVNDLLRWARINYRNEQFDVASSNYKEILSNISRDDPDRNLLKTGEYADCMYFLSYSKWENKRMGRLTPSVFLQLVEQCEGIGGEFLKEGLAQLRPIYNEQQRRMHELTARTLPFVDGIPTADSTCLRFRQPHNTGVGCAPGKTWIMTHVAVSRNSALGCPDPVRFRYVDEEGDQVADAPTTLQTCGSPPLNVRIKR